MHRKYLLPAATALTAHAVLLLGFKPGPVVAPRPPDAPPVIDISPVPRTPEPDDEPVSVEPGAARLRGGQPVPGAPEPTLTAARVDELTIPAPPRMRVTPALPLSHVPDAIGEVAGAPVAGPDGWGGVIAFDGLDNQPRATVRVSPVYPYEQRRNGITGTVTVAFVVDRDGVVRDAYVVRSDDRAFEEPALRAVARWRFEPGRKDGRTVPFRMAVPIVFNLLNDA